jgi:CubicO group peptidase (beta-lactamase class C family)
VAITKGGKLVFAKGYGLANTATDESVTPFHLFRVASISKPITSAAILKLEEEGKLSLEDFVFGESGILGNDFNYSDERIKEITVLQLLNHTAGGWANDRNDPMFQYQSLSSQDLIKKIVATRSLQSSPGSKYAYSNFGYCILGRVIEKVTGESYSDFVRNKILLPIGITEMYIGNNEEEERYSNEVKYYSQEKASAYSFNLNRMDAHGGWIASSVDLLKLLVHIDGMETKADILSAASIGKMSLPSLVNKNYALGWQVNRQNNWWHTGCLPGTASLIVRTNNGYCWTILLNSRSIDPSFFSDMDREMWNIIESGIFTETELTEINQS